MFDLIIGGTLDHWPWSWSDVVFSLFRASVVLMPCWSCLAQIRYRANGVQGWHGLAAYSGFAIAIPGGWIQGVEWVVLASPFLALLALLSASSALWLSRTGGPVSQQDRRRFLLLFCGQLSAAAVMNLVFGFKAGGS